MEEFKEAVSANDNVKIRHLLSSNKDLVTELKIEGIVLKTNKVLNFENDNIISRLSSFYRYDNYDNYDDYNDIYYSIITHKQYFLFEEIKDLIDDTIVALISPSIKYYFEIISDVISKELLVQIGNIDYIRESSYEYDSCDLQDTIKYEKIDIARYLIVEKNIYCDQLLRIALCFSNSKIPQTLRFLVEEMKYDINRNLNYFYYINNSNNTTIIEYFLNNGLHLTISIILKYITITNVNILKFLMKKKLIIEKHYNRVFLHLINRTYCKNINSIKHMLKSGVNFSIITNDRLRKAPINVIKFLLDYNIENEYNINYDIPMIFEHKLRYCYLDDIKYFVDKHSIELKEEHFKLVKQRDNIFKYMIEEKKVNIPNDIINLCNYNNIKLIKYLIEKNVPITNEWISNKIYLLTRNNVSRGLRIGRRRNRYYKKLYIVKILKILKDNNKITGEHVKQLLFKKNKHVNKFIDIEFTITEEEKKKILRMKEKSILKILYKKKKSLFTKDELKKIKQKIDN